MPETRDYIEKKVAMTEATYNGLNKLSKQRKYKGAVICKNKDIVAQLVANAVKRECK
jgi:hypothetical protein